METAFEVREDDGDSLNALGVGEVFEPLLLELVGGDAGLSLLFCLQVQVFELFVGQLQEVSKFVRHESPSSHHETTTGEQGRLEAGQADESLRVRSGGNRACVKRYQIFDWRFIRKRTYGHDWVGDRPAKYGDVHAARLTASQVRIHSSRAPGAGVCV